MRRTSPLRLSGGMLSALRTATLTTLAALATPAILASSTRAADGAAKIAAGERTYALRCKGCHAPPFTGFFMLERRLGAAQANLAERGAVNADYVAVVVRNGLNSMPHIPRGDISDPQLSEIVLYLNRPRAPPVDAGAAASGTK